MTAITDQQIAIETDAKKGKTITLTVGTLTAIIAAGVTAWTSLTSLEVEQATQTNAIKAVEQVNATQDKQIDLIDDKIEDLGALMLEQGAHQRELLIELAGKRAPKMPGKSASLEAAEAKVRRH